MDAIKDQLNQISQVLYHKGEELFEADSIDASRVMFSAMMSAGAAALLDSECGGLKEILDSIGEIIDQINVAIIKGENGNGLH